MLLLALDTTTAACSVALANTGQLIAEVTTIIPRTHSQRLLPLVHGLLSETPYAISDVEGIAVSRGPGSFTGLRIGLATARGLALALNVPVVGISSLEVLAHGAGVNGLVCPTLNARREQVYAGLFRAGDGQPQVLIDGQALASDDLLAQLSQWEEPVWFCGDAGEPVWQQARHKLAEARLVPAHYRWNRAAALADLAFYRWQQGEMVTEQQLTPLYLRESQAELLRRQSVEKNG